jgi:hypothetical protein
MGGMVSVEHNEKVLPQRYITIYLRAIPVQKLSNNIFTRGVKPLAREGATVTVG